MKNYKMIFLELILINLIFVITVSINAQKTIGITYVANEGFLVTGSSDSILIDGIFTEGWGLYHTPSVEILTQERSALSPFNGVKVLLISHKDADHLNANYVSEHMVNNAKSILIGSAQVESKLKAASNYSTISDRIKTLTPTAGTKIDTLIQNIKFEVMSIAHEANAGTQNTPFLFSIDGFKIFHAGDANTTTPSEYQNLNLANDSIDIAFFPCWFFDTKTGNMGQDIIKYIKPKAVVLMHIEINKFATYKNTIEGLTGLPPLYIIDEQMKKVSFKRENDSIKFVTDPTGIKKDIDNKIVVYPNPTSGFLNIVFGKVSNYKAEIDIFSIDGKRIFKKTVLPTLLNTIDLTGYAKGMYIVRLLVGGDVINKKIYLQ